MKKYIILSVYLLASMICRAQNPIAIPPEFVEIPLPNDSSDEYYVLNHSKNEFEVAIVDGKLSVFKKTNYNNIAELVVDGGKLVGIDRGEWGGELQFQPDNAFRMSRVIEKGNIRFIFMYKDKICYLEGLAHLGFDYGGLYELTRKKNRFKSSQLIDLDGSPYAYTIFNDDLLVVTADKFYVIEDFNTDLVFDNLFWWGLYPNSVAVVDNQNVFVGMRAGIAHLDLISRTMKFYKHID